MSQDLIEIRDPVEWDRALAAFEFVPPGQAASWSGSCHVRNHEILRFASTTAGAIAVQGVLKRSMGIKRFYADNGPVLGKACDEKLLLSFVAALRERLGKECLVSFSGIQIYDAQHEVWLRRAGFQRPWSAVLSSLTLYVDCSDSASFQQLFSADWRKNIRKAEKNDLTLEAIALADAAARQDFLALYTETFQTKGAQEQIDLPMLEVLGQDSRYRVFFASKDGRRVSGRVVFVSGTMAFDLAAGTSANGRKLSATHFLVASILKELGRSGVASFDFGRIGPGRYDSIDFFKQGSGGRPVAYLGEWSLSSRPWLEFAQGVVRFIRRGERW